MTPISHKTLLNTTLERQTIAREGSVEKIKLQVGAYIPGKGKLLWISADKQTIEYRTGLGDIRRVKTWKIEDYLGRARKWESMV